MRSLTLLGVIENGEDEGLGLSSAVALGVGETKLVAVTTSSEEIPSVVVTTEVADKMGDRGEPISLVARGVGMSEGEVLVEVMPLSEAIVSVGVGSIVAVLTEVNAGISGVIVTLVVEAGIMLSSVSVGEAVAGEV